MQKRYIRSYQKSCIVGMVYSAMIILAFVYPLVDKSILWTIVGGGGILLCATCILVEGRVCITPHIIMWLLTILPVVINSYAIKVHEFGFTTMWLLNLMLIPIAYSEIRWIKFTIKLLLILSMIYTISTLLINMGITSGLESLAALFRSHITVGTFKTAGLTSHYSENAVYISVGCIISSAILFGNEKKSKWVVLMTAMCISALLLTQKRGPLIAVGASIFLTYFIAHKESMTDKIKRIVIFIIVATILLYISYILFPNMFSVLDRFSSDNMLTNREDLWESAWNLFNENKLIGAGWGSYSHNLNLVIDTVSVSDLNAHNIYLQLLAETGVLGGICFLIPMMYTLRKSTKLLQNLNDSGIDSTSLFLSVGMQILFMIYGLTGNVLYDKQMYIPYMLSISYYFCYARDYTTKLNNIGRSLN